MGLDLIFGYAIGWLLLLMKFFVVDFFVVFSAVSGLELSMSHEHHKCKNPWHLSYRLLFCMN